MLVADIAHWVFNKESGRIKVEGGMNMRFLYGDTAPGSTLGSPEDVYMDTVTGEFYKNCNGTWTLVGTLIGPEGKKGETGATGASGVNVVNITSDDENLIFHLADESTINVPWPTKPKDE